MRPQFEHFGIFRFYRATLCIARSLLSCGMSVRLSICLSRWCIMWWFHQSSFLIGDPTVKFRRDHSQQGRQKEVVYQIQYLIVSRKRWWPYETLIGIHRCCIELCHSRWLWMMFEGHFGNPVSNFLVPLNIFGTDDATHFKFGRQIELVFGKWMISYPQKGWPHFQNLNHYISLEELTLRTSNFTGW